MFIFGVATVKNKTIYVYGWIQCCTYKINFLFNTFIQFFADSFKLKRKMNIESYIKWTSIKFTDYNVKYVRLHKQKQKQNLGPF